MAQNRFTAGIYAHVDILMKNDKTFEFTILFSYILGWILLRLMHKLIVD